MGATMMAIPSRTIQQRWDALERANRIRSYRAQLKKDIAAGRIEVWLLLRGNDPDLDTMKVQELMLAAPKFGRVKVDKILRRQVISPSKTIGGLSDRQRGQLVTALGGTMEYR